MVSTSGERRLNPGSAIVLVTLVCLQGNLFATFITLASGILYVHYAGAGLADQLLAAVAWHRQLSFGDFLEGKGR
jgi:hypothetical protein